ncbi:flagellar hook-length control protein FliK [Pelotalea chapellei]|uniref:Flagellar hook-length control protein FliK n=1 Tax=Pelotalea chapellei TaxID=44671 RepID=A0ABS5U8F6_9BACT|nr:flagellar hook-length control protein FliK [Pelotalea chapellei]MBT1071946.1 flagellar hook-length control protein FliK [Pelotalea chapellei]
MNAGQIIVQRSSGTNGVMSMISPTASVPVSEQDGFFAGVLSRTFAQEGQAVAQLAAESKKPEFSAVSELKKAVAGKDADQEEQKIPVMMASLFAVVDTAAAQPVTTNAGIGTSDVLTDEQQSVEEKMPQNVELNTAGMQIIQALQGNGRMPASEYTVDPQASDQVQDAPVIVPQQTQRMYQGQQLETAFVQASVQSPEAEILQNVEPIVVNEQDVSASQMGLKEEISKEATASQSPEIKMAQNVESSAISGKKQMEKSLMPDNEQIASFMVKPQGQPVPAVKAQDGAQEGAPKMDALAEVPGLKTAPVGQENVMPQKPASKSNAVHGAVQYVSQGIEMYGSKVPEVSAVSADKNIPAGMGEFRFAGSVAVDVELGNAQQVSDRNLKKSESVSIEKLMAAASSQLEIDSSASTESNFTSSEQHLNGYTQEMPAVPRPVAQHIAAVHQPFVVETVNPTMLQSVPTETSRLEAHENIANQVRERLGAHALKAGNDQIVFRLSPENMGEIKVHLRLEDQRLRVEIVAENRMAREGLLQHVDSLKESLSRQNISMDKFSVTSGESQANSQGGNNAQGEWRELVKNRQSQQWLNSGGYRLPSEEVLPTRQVYQGRTEHAMLDVHF